MAGWAKRFLTAGIYQLTLARNVYSTSPAKPPLVNILIFLI